MVWIGALAGWACQSPAASLTVATNVLGPTPEILAYNSGHFFPASNTRDWWRYAGVNGARVFISPSEVEFSDDLAPVGDGVTSQAGFLARKAALRADPLNTSYINWPYFLNRYESNDLYPNNHIRINYALGAMHQLGIRICAQITASESRLPITGPTDWGGKWELWQHYYAQAFYLGREFDVERYQMFNEPNHPNANGLTQENFLMRLQLASDAIQSALQDVNALYGKSLAANVLAPVTSGSAASSYTGGWGALVVTNRHVDFLGQTDPAFWLVHTYDYHQYNSSPSGFGGDLATLNGLLTSAMAPEPRFPTAISEFNVHTGATFDGLTETLDSPVKYSRFGAILVQLMANRCNELYAFKFSQTEYTGNYPVAKNAMHYVDNSNSPYQVGGVTQAGEVYRLFNKAFGVGRDRINTVKGSGTSGFEVHSSHDAAADCYRLFSVNDTASAVPIDMVLNGLEVPVGNRVLLEEVSEASHGGGVLWSVLDGGKTVSAVQPANSVWLLTAPAYAQAPEQILAATDDAEVRDGSNKNNNYGSAAALTARNDPVNTANRSAAFIRFELPAINPTDIEFAVLSLQASTVSASATVQAHVYGLNETNWTEGAITWNNAPNLRDNVPAGNLIANGCVEGAGDTARILGQVVASSTAPGEKLVDVTDYVRSRSSAALTFLVSQDPRWDVTLPSLAAGDTQPDGLRILSKEGGTGPRLRLVLRGSGPAQPPVANDLSYSLTENTTLSVPAPGVLTNDVNPGTNGLTAVLVAGPANGLLTLSTDGSFDYTPQTDYIGTDSFFYKASDGVLESGAATVSLVVNPAGGYQPVLTNIGATAEAFIRGGASANTDQDEAVTGYLMAKYNPSPFDTARKVYFQFDLSGLNVNPDTQAVFTVTTHTTNFAHRAQLWGLNQAYPGFTPVVTWNTAQANDTASNDLLTVGPETATAIGASQWFTSATSTPYQFTVPRIGDFLFGDRVTLVLAGVLDAANDAGGLRLARASALLQVENLVPAPPPVVTNPPAITGILINPDQSVTLDFLGTPNVAYRVQAATSLPAPLWLDLSTNTAASNGVWSVTDTVPALLPQRYYRAVAP